MTLAVAETLSRNKPKPKPCQILVTIRHSIMLPPDPPPPLPPPPPPSVDKTDSSSRLAFGCLIIYNWCTQCRELRVLLPPCPPVSPCFLTEAPTSAHGQLASLNYASNKPIDWRLDHEGRRHSVINIGPGN